MSQFRGSGTCLLLSLLIAVSNGCRRDGTDPGFRDKPGETIWHYKAFWGYGTPGVDGTTAYFTGFGHEVAALDKVNGTLRWQVVLPVSRPNNFGQGLVVGPEGVFVGDEDVFSLDPASGQIRWRFRPSDGRNPGLFLPSLVGSILLCGSSSGHVYAISASTGNLLWQTKVVPRDTVSVFHPVVDGSTVYVGFTDFVLSDNDEPLGGVAALDLGTGSVKWLRYIPPTESSTAPTATIEPVLVGEAVVAGSRDGPVHAFDRATGNVLWSAPGFVSRDIRPLAESRGLLFVGSTAKRLLALDPQDGRKIWELETPLGSTGWLRATDSDLIFVYAGGQLISIDPSTGHVRWDRDDPLASFPPIVDGEVLYVSGAGGLVALVR